MKKSGPWIPSVTVGVRKWLITNPDREGGDVKSNGQIDFFTVPERRHATAGRQRNVELDRFIGADGDGIGRDDEVRGLRRNVGSGDREGVLDAGGADIDGGTGAAISRGREESGGRVLGKVLGDAIQRSAYREQDGNPTGCGSSKDPA